MTVYAYLFELRSIQSALFATGKLKDMIAGSELIDYLCREPLEQALSACDLEGYAGPTHSPRCAGAAFYLLIGDELKAQQFREVWSILVAQLLPDVEAVDVLCAGTSAQEAIKQGLANLRIARNRVYPNLPCASPIARRSPRTGKVATASHAGELVDAGTAIKRRFTRPKGTRLSDRFFSEDTVLWPDNFDASAVDDRRFPLTKNRLVGLVHADGNGLGQVLRTLTEATREAEQKAYIRLYRIFSDGLDLATARATSKACAEVLIPAINSHHVMPARPLVLGGDDLTVLVRADLALPFTRSFLYHFETQSRDFLSHLREDMQAQGLHAANIAQIPESLSACAGIIYMKASQPFAQSYALAEDLCNRAKQQSRAQAHGDGCIPSSLAFHRLQGSVFNSAEQLFQRELLAQSFSGSGTPLALGLPAYGLHSSNHLPALGALAALAHCFGPEKLSDGRLRNLATLLHADEALARKNYARWRELARKSPPTATALHHFDTALEELLGSRNDSLPTDKDCQSSPLADLLNYLSIHCPNVEDTAHA